MKKSNFNLGLFVALFITSCTIEEEYYFDENIVDRINGVDGKDGENEANAITNAECYHYELDSSDFVRNLDSGENYVYQTILWESNETDERKFYTDLEKDIVNVYVHTSIDNGIAYVYKELPTTIINEKGLKLEIDYSIAEDESSNYVKVDMQLLSKKPFKSEGLGELKFKVINFSDAE